MLFLLIFLALAALGITAAVVHRWPSNEKKEEDAPETELARVLDMECCGQHEVCEKDSLLAALSKKIEYYDDEELDRFRGRQADEYSAAEADEFREVLYTMRPDEVAGWARSLQLRAVELPDEVKDEVYLIVGERRS